MTEALHEVLEGLPQSSLTTHILGALDAFVPGEWSNITVIYAVSSESRPNNVMNHGAPAATT